MNSGNDDKELHEIMRTQMGMDPDTCDPATMSIIRQKFFSKAPASSETDPSEVKTVSKKKKGSKKNKKATHNDMDMMNNEDDEPEYLRADKEEEIHLKAPTETRKVTLGHGANKYEATVTKSDQLDFGDLFNQIDHSAAQEVDKLNTTKITDHDSFILSILSIPVTDRGIHLTKRWYHKRKFFIRNSTSTLNQQFVLYHWNDAKNDIYAIRGFDNCDEYSFI